MARPVRRPQRDQRAPARRPGNQRSRPAAKLAPRPWWQSSGVMGGGAAAVVVILIVAFVVLGSKSSTPSAPQPGPGPASAAMLAAVTKPGPAVVASVGTGGQPGRLSRIAGTTVAKGIDGKPLIVYVGGEFCPYCAAETWSIVMAMARFGDFGTLQRTTSSSTDAAPDTNTFTFHGSSYSSSMVDFQPVEIEDRDQKPLETLTAPQSQVFTTMNQPPYTSSQGSLPFLDIAGRFILNGTGFDPQILQGLSWDQIASDLTNAGNPVTQAIIGNADFLTAATCAATNDQPASVCSAAVRGIESTLNAQPPVG